MRKQKNIARVTITILALASLMSTAALMPIRPARAHMAGGSWTITGSLGVARQGHTATLLKNGKVLVAGGISEGFLSSAELYDPATGTWSYTGSLNKPRSFCTATPLPDGKVLVVGGFTNNNPPDFGITNTAELYDPSSGTWSLTGNLGDDRAWHSATLLRSGKVLVAGGTSAKNTLITNAAELWDPVTGTWTTTGSLATARYSHTATLLQDGDVLIAGGTDDGDVSTTLAGVELYEPGTGHWTTINSLGTTRVFHAATVLPGGKVLASGGYRRDGWGPSSSNSVELYDPAIKTWSHTGSLNEARERHTATLLTGGQVLVVGGYDWDLFKTVASTERFDVSTGSWTIEANLNIARTNHTATLLLNGKVLVAGGNGAGATAELYDPGTSPVPEPVEDATFQLTLAAENVSEQTAVKGILVTRSGDTSRPATVNFSTSDVAGLANCAQNNGIASERCDYATTVGTLRFVAGELESVIMIPIVNDSLVEGNETFQVTLSAPTGATLGAQTTTTLTIIDNDTTPAAQNPIDGVEYFVNQQYIDFLGRLPDTTGLANWVATLRSSTNGGFGEFDDPTRDRVHVSAGFFLSDEFRGRGYWAYRFYEVAFNRRPAYGEFVPAMARVGGSQSPQSELLSKAAYTDDFVLLTEFVTRYHDLSNQGFLDALEVNAEVTLTNKTQLLADLNGNMKTRAQVLRDIVESPAVEDQFFIRAFVAMQYFGYLRRDPDTTGYNNWVATLTDNPSDYRHMIFGFIYSDEYRTRFGQ